jgi:hypothetical protein
MLNLMSPSGQVTKNGLTAKLSAIGLTNRLIAKPMNVHWRYNMNYVTMFIGLLILILIPEYASIFQVAIQSFIGLGIFAIGAINLLDNAN